MTDLKNSFFMFFSKYKHWVYKNQHIKIYKKYINIIYYTKSTCLYIYLSRQWLLDYLIVFGDDEDEFCTDKDECFRHLKYSNFAFPKSIEFETSSRPPISNVKT